MRIGIVGLGLIGGSLAKAYKRREGVTVLGVDQDASITAFAQMAEAIDDALTVENMVSCDVILLATYPVGVVEWVKAHAKQLPQEMLVIDCSGTKATICETLFPIAKEHGFHFVGGHPMAGTHQSGFKYSVEDLFDGAPMVIVPPTFDDIRLLERVKAVLAPIGFGHFSYTTAKEHDELIAFTSQMPHLISNGFIKSPTAKRHQGYSAGSYKDLTRVAWLNPEMWAELFLENKAYLLQEMETFMAAITAYKEAIEQDDEQQLIALLDAGRQCKKEVDGP
ncbi:MAG: prephenate dehydrogenase/arogenate dehydrogenase family protein [Defluviitaleaceae bacterium]|nr:prephenate dehydrogenase/arogenate dehydrogenase family protein [Defluviitaleaceae bacterium]